MRSADLLRQRRAARQRRAPGRSTPWPRDPARRTGRDRWLLVGLGVLLLFLVLTWFEAGTAVPPSPVPLQAVLAEARA